MTRYSQSQALARPARLALPRLRHRITPDTVRSAARRVAMVTLIAGMAVISIALWLVSPTAWLWIASRVTDAANPGLGPYALLAGGILITTIVLARVLGAADRLYARLARTPKRRVHRAWLRSSGQHELERPAAGTVGVVMTISVVAALIALVAYVVMTGRPLAPVPLFSP